MSSVAPVKAPRTLPQAFEAMVEAADRALVAGDKVYMHCGAGCGRAGVFAARIMVHHGVEPIDAIEQFRAVRGCGPETAEQAAYVVRHAARWGARG